MSVNKKAIFIHIPKTGGSTLHEIIIREYGHSGYFHIKNNREIPQFIILDAKAKEKIKLLKGHMAFGHHIHFSPKENVTYFTMMRDPIKRIISYYHFILKREVHDLHNALITNNYSLKEFIESGIDVHTENNQVRLLSNNIDAPHGQCTREMLEIAKHNIETHFSVAGINEMYDETLLLYKEFYNWKTPYYILKNVTGHGVKITDLDNETIETIKKYNALDIELYEWVKDRFKKEIELKGEPFQKQLIKFKKRNKLVQKIIGVRNKIIGRK